MTFWHEMNRWRDMHTTVRKGLVCSCTQHAAAEHLKASDLLMHEGCAPIHEELDEICGMLMTESKRHKGKKPYHDMVAGYFHDCSLVLMQCRHVLREKGRAIFIIGDSAPYGVHIPVEKLLGELSIAVGFRSWKFEKIRDRNTKWKLSRKHDIPLHEGILTLYV